MSDIAKVRKNSAFKLIFGISLGLIFLYLSFRNVDFKKMAESLSGANYWYVIVALLVLMFGHYLRAVRWRIFLMPIKVVNANALFSALSIGYAANTFLPGHLGELLRAYVLGKRENLSASATFATIVLERIVDVVSLVAIMGIIVLVHPFPDWVINCGVIMFVVVIAMLAVMIAFKAYKERLYFLVDLLLKVVPKKYRSKAETTFNNFYDGLVPLDKIYHYPVALLLTALIWFCYGLVYYFCIKAFGFDKSYTLPWYIGIVVLVITTISIVVPTSPGYIGTYHFLCQTSLAIFGISASEALSYASVAHAINIVPITVVGVIFANLEGIAFYKKKNLHTQLTGLEGQP